MTLLEAVCAHLAAAVPSRVVYSQAVPDGPAAARYLLVVGDRTASTEHRLVGAVMATPTIWVTSVAVGPRDQAAAEAEWAATKAQSALLGWTPAVGAVAWDPTPLSSQPVRRDDSLPGDTVMFAVDSYGFQYQP